MKKIIIADATLRLGGSAECAPGFKEKTEIVKALERLGVDIIETAPPVNGKSDILLLHTIAPLAGKRILSCSLPLDETLIESGWHAIAKAKHPRLHLMAPVSAARMEYLCHQKVPAFLESLRKWIAKAKGFGAEVEVSLLDATRAERETLAQAVQVVCEEKADVLTLCDNDGTLLPDEMRDFVAEVAELLPEKDAPALGVECSNGLHLGFAAAMGCVEAGATQIKCAVAAKDALPLGEIADFLRVKGRDLDLATSLDLTVAERLIGNITAVLLGNAVPHREESRAVGEAVQLTPDADIAEIGNAVSQLGYELSADDLAKVFEEYRRIASKKTLGVKDLDAIVAAVAMQVPPTFKLKSFVITSGNIVTSMAHVILLRKDEEVQGFSMGDGPIDAAFLSIENVLGVHFELDDFKINAVTEGREAVASAIVRLRSNGKLFSGKGISTDVIGAGIRAYIDALNKIYYDESAKQ